MMKIPFHKISYTTRLMVAIVGPCLLLVVMFLVFQLNREREFSARELNSQLQVLNTNILDHLDDGYTPQQWMPGLDLPFKELRISIIERKTGRLIYDNVLEKPLPVDNHLYRPEVVTALESPGQRAYVKSRRSASNGREYFFSVYAGPTTIVRTAAPYYAVSVGDFLEGDRTFLWYMAGAMVLIFILAFEVTRRIGGTIRRLHQFARAAEGGERIYDTDDFPRDELGAISRHIVRLYVRLQQTTAERDRQQLMLMEEEENKQRIKRDLTNNINHELKTPVASVSVTLETLLEYPDLPAEKREQLLKRCAANARRLGTLLRDVSTITRIDEGSSLIEQETIDLAALIEEIVDDMTTRAESKGLSLYTSLPRTMPMKGNTPLLESVFRNLVENAIAYSGGSKLTISVLEASDDMFTIVVADNGCGIPEEHLSRLFERFYRIDKGRSRAMGGTGLGLAIVKNAVQFHGGDVEVRNRSTGGLEFILSLPRAPLA